MDIGTKEVEQRLQDRLRRAKESDSILASMAKGGSLKKSALGKATVNVILKMGLQYKDSIKKLPGVSSVAKRAYWRIIRNRYY